MSSFIQNGEVIQNADDTTLSVWSLFPGNKRRHEIVANHNIEDLKGKIQNDNHTTLTNQIKTEQELWYKKNIENHYLVQFKSTRTRQDKTEDNKNRKPLLLKWLKTVQSRTKINLNCWKIWKICLLKKNCIGPNIIVTSRNSVNKY